MTNYDFLNLSPYEFEVLNRDLLQAHLGVFLESFGAGTDSGIDLRYAKGEQFIVQCKRYQDYDSLYQVLKKEAETVKKLTPARYIVATSVSLLPERKKKILNLFTPYILSTDDILGKDKLNNLLQQHPEVERNHFKLWLSSTNVLQTILNRQIVNQSKFVLDDIRDKLKVYVQNDSFSEARKILQDNHYVIISGIPGIGKTTLAEVLVYDALASGYEEFIYLSGSIKEGFKMYEEGRSQVFLFDDFLGKNFFSQ